LISHVAQALGKHFANSVFFLQALATGPDFIVVNIGFGMRIKIG
jgi:hypothetical protein